jgi:hypothetical protein
MERRPSRSDARSVDAHGIDHLDVHDVEAATPIHQHLAEAVLINDQINNERVSTRMRNVV